MTLRLTLKEDKQLKNCLENKWRICLNDVQIQSKKHKQLMDCLENTWRSSL